MRPSTPTFDLDSCSSSLFKPDSKYREMIIQSAQAEPAERKHPCGLWPLMPGLQPLDFLGGYQLIGSI